MDYMELQFPDDAREVSMRQGRNISDTERWASMAAGAGMFLYGLSRRRMSGWALAGLYPVSFDRPTLRVIEHDAVLVRTP